MEPSATRKTVAPWTADTTNAQARERMGVFILCRTSECCRPDPHGGQSDSLDAFYQSERRATRPLWRVGSHALLCLQRSSVFTAPAFGGQANLTHRSHLRRTNLKRLEMESITSGLRQPVLAEIAPGLSNQPPSADHLEGNTTAPRSLQAVPTSSPLMGLGARSLQIQAPMDFYPLLSSTT